MKGSEVVGMKYEPLFDFASTKLDSDHDWSAQLDNYVSDDSGTGLVHILPSTNGEDDVRIFQRENIPVFDPVR